MKKINLFLLIASFGFAVACGGGAESDAADHAEDAVEAVEETPEEATEAVEEAPEEAMETADPATEDAGEAVEEAAAGHDMH